jgi:hypothetical protein
MTSTPRSTSRRRLALSPTLWATCAVTALSLPGAASAQAETTDADYDGRWSVSVHDASVPTRTARVEIDSFDGRWHDRTPRNASNRACAGKTFPITVQARSDREIAFTVWGSSIAPACPDIAVALSPKSVDLLEGRFASGGTVAFKRLKRR